MYEIKPYKNEKPLQRWQLYKQHNAALMSEFALYKSIYSDIRDYLAPRTARFDGEKVNDPTRQDLKIINSHPRLAVRTLSAGMQSGVTSPLRPWFKLGFADPDLADRQNVKEWVFAVESLMRDVFSRSNVYDRLKSNYGTMGIYGTGGFFLDGDDEDLIRAFDFPAGTFRMAVSYSNRPDTMFRDVSFTTINMIKKFGARCPDIVKMAYDRGDYYTRYPLIHVTEPNDQYTPASALSQRKKFASVWFDPSKDGEESILKYSGYDYNPFMGGRWDLLGEDTYGIGCGEFSLGDAKQIQLMEKRKLQGIDKNVNPTMVADASLRGQRTSLLPGDTTYVNGLIATGNAGYRAAYEVNPYIAELREEIQNVGSRIDEAFYKNLFLTVLELGDQPNITATQINALREEKLQQLGPVLERLNDELLNPLIDATFFKLQENGMLPPAPEEIQGLPLKVEYISILAQAQKAMGIGNIERFIGFVGNLTAFEPQARHKLDAFEAIDVYADYTSIPPKLLRSNEDATAQQQGEAQAMQQQQLLEQIQPMSQAVKNFSDVSQTANIPALQDSVNAATGGATSVR